MYAAGRARLLAYGNTRSGGGRRPTVAQSPGHIERVPSAALCGGTGLGAGAGWRESSGQLPLIMSLRTARTDQASSGKCGRRAKHDRGWDRRAGAEGGPGRGGAGRRRCAERGPEQRAGHRRRRAPGGPDRPASVAKPIERRMAWMVPGSRMVAMSRSPPPRAARSSWTRSATCRRTCRCACRACSFDGEYSRVGGHAPLKSNVRVIAATHQNLEERVGQGLFRDDLMYRLNVVRLRLPPLSERREGRASGGLTRFGAPYRHRRRRRCG